MENRSISSVKCNERRQRTLSSAMSLSFCSRSSAEASTGVPSTVSTGGALSFVEYDRAAPAYALDRRMDGVDRVDRIAVRRSEIDADIFWLKGERRELFSSLRSSSCSIGFCFQHTPNRSHYSSPPKPALSGRSTRLLSFFYIFLLSRRTRDSVLRHRSSWCILRYLSDVSSDSFVENFSFVLFFPLCSARFCPFLAVIHRDKGKGGSRLSFCYKIRFSSFFTLYNFFKMFSLFATLALLSTVVLSAPVPSTGCTPYVVQAGDNCYSIAQASGMQSWEFTTLNNISPDCSNLQIGQSVCLDRSSNIPFVLSFFAHCLLLLVS